MAVATSLSEEQIQADLEKREADEAVKKEKKAELERIKHKMKPPVDFVRKNRKSGVYSTQALGRRIMIKDRQHFVAKTKAEVKFFNEDPEMEVFNPGESNKKQKK